MTTREFIAKTYNTESDKERQCSSVFTSHNGQVYSYGYHYPLAFNLKGMDFINTAGYSNTTAKHINWAWQAVGYHAVAVNLWREEAQVIASAWATEDEKLQAVLKALYREHSQLMETMSTKKRKDTQVYRSLESEATRVTESIKRVQEAA